MVRSPGSGLAGDSLSMSRDSRLGCVRRFDGPEVCRSGPPLSISGGRGGGTPEGACRGLWWRFDS